MNHKYICSTVGSWTGQTVLFSYFRLYFSKMKKKVFFTLTETLIGNFCHSYNVLACKPYFPCFILNEDTSSPFKLRGKGRD